MKVFVDACLEILDYSCVNVFNIIILLKLINNRYMMHRAKK